MEETEMLENLMLLGKDNRKLASVSLSNTSSTKFVEKTKEAYENVTRTSNPDVLLNIELNDDDQDILAFLDRKNSYNKSSINADVESNLLLDMLARQKKQYHQHASNNSKTSCYSGSQSSGIHTCKGSNCDHIDRGITFTSSCQSKSNDDSYNSNDDSNSSSSSSSNGSRKGTRSNNRIFKSKSCDHSILPGNVNESSFCQLVLPKQDIIREKSDKGLKDFAMQQAVIDLGVS